ncbi:MAG TPA: M56 family metallopeptidase [Vicinamibacterales bacterium]|nr:M56 family metallopeptidase [Vicinamibacterales bacterium]
MSSPEFVPATDILIKVTVLLMAALLATRALARRSAAIRHHIWALAIAASLLLPALAVVAPRWTIEVLPTSTSSEPAASVQTMTIAAPVQMTNIADDVAAPIVAPSALIPSRNERAAMASPFSIATSIWIAGALLVLARVAFGTARVWWIARRAQKAPGWTALGRELTETIGLDRCVTFVSGDDDAMPMAWGLWRPLVLLPSEADDWPVSRQRVVLLHELAHVKRRDCLTQFIAQLACAAYWFNPLVWVAARRLRVERERACDDLVLAAGTRGSDYADHLLDIARSLRSGAWPTWSAVTMAHRSQLEGRLMAILDPALSRRSPTRGSVAAVAALAIIGVVSLAGVRPVAKAATLTGEEAASPNASSSIAPTDPAGTPDDQGRPSAPSTPTPAPMAMPMPTPMPAPMPTPMPMPAPLVSINPLPIPDVNIDIDSNGIARAITGAVSAFGQDAPRVVIGNRGNRGPADPRVVAALTDALKDENKEVRQQALHTLVSMRAAIPPDTYMTLLKDSDPEVRQQAVFGLGQIRDPKYLDPLMAALKDQNADVRHQAAFAIGQIRDPRAVDPLAAALKDSDPEVRQQAAFALGQIRDPRAIDPLIAALKDSNAHVRQQAAFALGQIR